MRESAALAQFRGGTNLFLATRAFFFLLFFFFLSFFPPFPCHDQRCLDPSANFILLLRISRSVGRPCLYRKRGVILTHCVCPVGTRPGWHSVEKALDLDVGGQCSAGRGTGTGALHAHLACAPPSRHPYPSIHPAHRIHPSVNPSISQPASQPAVHHQACCTCMPPGPGLRSHPCLKLGCMFSLIDR